MFISTEHGTLTIIKLYIQDTHGRQCIWISVLSIGILSALSEVYYLHEVCQPAICTLRRLIRLISVPIVNMEGFEKLCIVEVQ